MDEHWQKQSERLWQQAQERHGHRIRLRAKRDALWLWWPLALLYKIATLGKGVDLLDGNYYGLIGYTIWMPGDGSKHSELPPHLWQSILSHEIDHLDARCFGDHDARNKEPQTLKTRGFLRQWFHQLLYVFWPFPYLVSRYREKIESWGHARNLEQHIVSNHGKCSRWYRKWLILQFCGPTYMWMCSKKRAFAVTDRLIAEVEADLLAGKLDHLKPPNFTFKSNPPSSPPESS